MFDCSRRPEHSLGDVELLAGVLCASSLKKIGYELACCPSRNALNRLVKACGCGYVCAQYSRPVRAGMLPQAVTLLPAG